VTRAFAAVGRTAFTNYLLQTVVATTVFYGHGLGLFGAVSRAEALGMVVAFWAIEILVSVVWLRRFRFGPVEWVWRTLTYGERQPI
jgi:Predicted membrane protein